MVLGWLHASPQRHPSATPKPVDEKITINVGCVDLGQIDLLVQEGFYANRTDLIRTAIRNQLATHGDVVRQAVVAQDAGAGHPALQRRRPASGQGGRGRCCRSACWAWPPSPPTSRPALALATIESLTVLGALHASPAVKAALRDRIR